MNRQSKHLISMLLMLSTSLSVTALDTIEAHKDISQTADRAAELLNKDPKQSAILSEQALEQLSEHPNFELEYRLKLIIADSFLEQNLLAQSIAILQKLLHQLDNNDLPIRKAQVLSRIGEVYWYQGAIYQSIEHLEKSLALYQAAGQDKDISSALNNIGIMYRHLGDYDRALSYFLRSLQVKQKLGDKSAIASTLNNIGVLYYFLQKYDKAIEQYDRAIALYEEVNERVDIADPLNNKGQALEKLGQLTNAIEFYQKSLVIEQATNNKRGQGYSHANIGAVLRKLGRRDEAKIHLEHSVLLADESKVSAVQTESLLQLGLLHADLGESEKAIDELTKGLQIALTTNEAEKVKSFHFQLSNLYEAKGQYKKALKHFREYKVVNDQLFNTDRKDKITRMEYQNKLGQREQEIKLLRQQNEIKSLQIENSRSSRYIIIGLSLLGMVVFGLTLAILYNRKKLLREREVSVQLAQLDDLKTQFLSQTSEQLLTPIERIQKNTNALFSNQSRSSKERQQLKDIEAEVTRLSLQIRNLLDFSADREQTLTLNLAPVDFYDVNREIVCLLQSNFDDHSISYINQVSEKLPRVKADQDRVKQILFNIHTAVLSVVNTGTIYLHAIPLDHQLIVRISNTDLESESAQAFLGKEQSTKDIDSFQMKLALRLVELHEGELWVDQSPPSITVCFTLPLY